MKVFTMKAPDDFHLHLRRGDILPWAVYYSARQFRRAIIMPNVNPPILTAREAKIYRDEILIELSRVFGFEDNPTTRFARQFESLMTIQITDDTTPQMIYQAKESGIVFAGKVYPKGVTTGSQNGVSDFIRLYPVLAEMEKVGLVLSIHGQEPTSFCLDREKDFLVTLRGIVENFPNLKVVMEHISTKESVETVSELPDNVAATITAHHLTLTLHDVLSWVGPEGHEGLNPHHYCQPILQRPEDRFALQNVVLAGHPKFFFGSDSAPHVRGRKESSCGCAGVYSAPVLLPVLYEFFAQHKSLDKLQAFTAEFGAKFYGLPPNQGSIYLTEGSWPVLPEYNGIVPFRAGDTLEWVVTH